MEHELHVSVIDTGEDRLTREKVWFSGGVIRSPCWAKEEKVYVVFSHDVNKGMFFLNQQLADAYFISITCNRKTEHVGGLLLEEILKVLDDTNNNQEDQQ